MRWRLGLGVVMVVGWALAAAGCADDPGAGNGQPDVVAFATVDIAGDTATIADAAAIDTVVAQDTPASPDAAASDSGGPDVGGPADVAAQDIAGQPDGGTVTKYYNGVVLSEVDSEYVNVATASARFTLVPLHAAEQDFGACGVSYADPNAQPAPSYGFNAGTISVTGLTPTVMLTPANEGSAGTGYTSNVADGTENLLPSVASLLTIEAAGGADIGAFTAFVQAPEPISINSPSVSGLGGSASKSAPLTVTWPARNGDQILVTLSPLTNDLFPAAKAGPGMACLVDGDTGSFTIPLNALNAMGGGKHALSLTRLKSKMVTEAGGASVSATVTRSTGGILTLN